MINDAQRNAFIVRNYLRQLCRTNLYALCAVLGYHDVTPEVHAPMIDALQKFQGGEDREISELKFKYKPFIPLWKLQGRRDNMFLYPRGHLKTTVISIAHTIQWIINYPNIRVCISTSIGDQMELVLGSLLTQFRFNEDFRALFPELCPKAEKAADWGNKTEFTVPGRTDLTLKEPTVWTCSVGKVNAGFRADVTKHSDLVNEQNVKTPGGIKEVIDHFGHFEPIVERYSARGDWPSTHGWTDVEGTRYDFGDLYGIILKDPNFNVVIRSAIDEKGNSLWPQRFPLEELERIRKKPTVGDWIFSAQYLNKCIPQGDGLCDPKDVAFLPNDVINQLLPTLRLHCTVDLAGMEEARSGDYTAITVGGFDKDGRLYIMDIRCGRYAPEIVIEHIFDIHRKYPQIIDFKIEKEAHGRVLLPFLQREMSKRQKFPVIWPIKRDTHTSKQHRIRGLRPWFKTHIIRFTNNLPIDVRNELLDEIAQFPSQSSGVHDDILDTLADMMQNAEGGVTADVIADPPDMSLAQFGLQRPKDKFLGFAEDGVAQWLYGNDPHKSKNHSLTGFLN